MARIMTIGEILVEIMATERGQSFRAPGTLVGPFPSGAPAIFIDQVGRLGRAAGIIGCVGDDDFGWLNIDRLRRDGVDTRAIALLADAVTGSAFVTYTETGERHFIFNIANSASGRLSASSITESVLADCTWFHVMGSSLFSPGITAAVRKAIGMVKRRGGVISFDPNIRPEILRSVGIREALRIDPRTDRRVPAERRRGGPPRGCPNGSRCHRAATRPRNSRDRREARERRLHLLRPVVPTRRTCVRGPRGRPLAALRLRQWRDCRDAQRSHGGHCELCGIGHAHWLRRPAADVLPTKVQNYLAVLTPTGQLTRNPDFAGG
ncbi:MAG: sugar kinase [Silvibacterium sp.]